MPDMVLIPTNLLYIIIVIYYYPEYIAYMPLSPLGPTVFAAPPAVAR